MGRSTDKGWPVQPEELYFSVGGIMGWSYEFALEEGHLVYRTFSQGYWARAEAKIYVTEQEWEAFRKSLIELGLEDWLERYDSPMVDGTRWSLKVRFANLSVESSGNNAYPGRTPSETSTRYSTAFVALLSAFGQLLEGLEFAEIPSQVEEDKGPLSQS